MGCARSIEVSPSRVPSSLLLPIAHPTVDESPVTVEHLLTVIGQYDAKLDEANSRLTEIQYIQSGVMPPTSAQ